LVKGSTNQLDYHLRSIYSESKPTEFQKDLEFKNQELNDSQKQSVRLALGKGRIVSIQGPPGTGKTTTLVEAIHQLVKTNKKVIASAPSNTAVDNLAKRLIRNGLNIVRLGNTAKIDDDLWSKTPEGIISAPNYQKEFKKLRAQVNELQKKAEQFKRNFTKEDRENRRIWRKEARVIKKEIRELTHYHLSKHIKNADVILGTPIGLCNGLISEINFDVTVIDEAGQCLIPMGYLVMDNAEKVILCGDQSQLPPTVIDRKAEKNGLGKSILEEVLIDNTPDTLLSVQYRMPPQIATFSSNYFYKGIVKSFKKDEGQHLLFYDTAGAGYKEEESEGGSKHNPEELKIVQKIITQNNLKSATFISPYSAQVRAAKKELPEGIKCSTIDGFQGQEHDVVIISLVRNNENGKIGFLSDYRRMNVALTRSSSMLYIVGDSVTLAGDNFYQSFIDYVESNSAYRSVFELLYE
jgi:superfamily I DNA and/or RNA helicase